MRLTLVDDFSSGMAKATASALAFGKALDSVDGSNVDVTDGLRKSAREVDNLGGAFRRGGADINQFSGRLSLILQGVGALGPALVPLTAVAVPAVAGLASQFGFAAIGAGSLVVAAQGVGTALEAVNKAALEPTAANLEAARMAMSQIGPEAQEFVREFQNIRPVLSDIRDSAAAGWFPGLTESLDSLVELGPKVANIFEAIGEAGGSLLADGAASLAGPRWAEFLAFVEREAPAALTSLGHVVGDVAHGMAELWMAFTPVNTGFASWLEGVAAGFDSWAAGLAETQGFAEFVSYVQQVGPQVAETFTSLANAVLQIAEAAAPLGGPVLQGIEALADVIAGIADSDLGTPIMAAVAAFSAFKLASKAASTNLGQLALGQKQVAIGFGTAGKAVRTFGTDLNNVARYGTLATESTARLRSQLVTAGKSAALVGGLAVAMTGAGDAIGLTNTASLALAGTLGGPVGVAVGASIGAFLDMRAATQDLANQLDVMKVAADSNDLGVMRKALAGFESQLAETSEQTGFFDSIGDAFDALGLDADEASKVMADLRYDIGSMTDDLHRVGGEKALRNLLDPIKQIREGFNGVADAAGAMADAVRDATGFMDRQASFDNWRASILDARDALKENGATLDAFTRKGQANRAVLRDMGTAALDFASRLKGADRADFLANARKQIIGMAKDFGATDKEARKLVNGMELLGNKKVKAELDLDDKKFAGKSATAQRRLALLNAYKANPDMDLNNNPFLKAYGITKADLEWLDRKVSTADVNADVSGAVGPLNQVRSLLAGINSKTVRITTIHQTVGRNTSGGLTSDTGTSADGGTIPKDGGPYADRYPYLLAPGEEVISNRYGQADRHRALLKAINAGRLADGGTAGGVSDVQTVNSVFHSGLLDSTFGPFAETLAFWLREMRRDARDRLRDAERRARLAEKEAEASEEVRDSLRDASRSLSDTVSGKFAPGSDLLADKDAQGNAVDASFEGIIARLGDLRDRGNLFTKYAAQLKRNGLDGDALQYLLENASLDQLNLFANDTTAKQLQQFETTFNSTLFAANKAGETAGVAVFGERLAEANEIHRQNRAELKEANRLARSREKRLERVEAALDRVADKLDRVGGKTARNRS